MKKGLATAVKSKKRSVYITEALDRIVTIKAEQKNVSVSDYLRDIIVKHVNGVSENLIAQSLIKTHDKLKANNDKTEFMLQLFVFFISSFYAHHPGQCA